MGDPSVLRKDEAVQQGDKTGAAELSSLRALLVGPERREIQRLQARLDDTNGRAEDLAEVLPRVLLQHTQDPAFTRALTPPIEKAITTSVQRNPKPLADALFPVMGPAIRKAVAAGLAGMVESLNRTLEHSLSWRSLRWRLEAWRTGKSFAEVVLSKTLVYRVEQVFLIDRKAGLLLQHVQAEDLDVPDADMVSGLLTAIRDFAQDSFKVSAQDSLDTLEVGDLSVWIEAGPSALVAAVIRGQAPREFRHTLQETVEAIHLQFGEALTSFTGDTGPFADARSALGDCLATVYRAGERKPRSRGAWLLFSTATLALVVWAGFEYRAGRRWAHYLELVRAEPGVVVLRTEREGGRYVVSGLRDPIARDPATLLTDAGLSASDVVLQWAPYQALEPRLILARATDLLRPPAGVTLTLENGVMAATGNPPLAWVAETSRLAAFVPGVARFDVARTLEPAASATIRSIESRTVQFVKGTAQPMAGADETLAGLVEDVRQLSAIAAASGARFALDLVGHTDVDGPDEANLPLSEERARVVVAALDPAARSQLTITHRGVGSLEPAGTGQDEETNRRNRRVVTRVTRLDGGQ